MGVVGGAGRGGRGSAAGGDGGSDGGSGNGVGGRANTSGGSGGDGAGTGGGTESAGEAGAGTEALSFEADIWPVFSQTRDPVFVYPGGTEYEGCTTGGVCHGGRSPGAQLFMTDAATAYSNLIDVPSSSALCAGTIRVVAGDPESSCLVLFYEGRLRDELDWVDDAEIDFVREWIAQGALP